MVNNCKYHPLEPGTYHCANCDINCCDNCVDDSRFNPVARCFQCGGELESLGPGNIEPFWRRLQQSFKYPMTTQTMVLILGLSVMCSIAVYLPFALLIYLVLFGSGFKYCLSCLSATSQGYMTPPDITEAYEGGFRKMLVLILMLFVVGLVNNLAYHYLGSAVGSVVALLTTIAFPAILINYALTDSILESLNPANIIHLINSIGLPYGLILAFIMIMAGSVAVLFELVAIIPSSLDSIFVFTVMFYYAVVLYHLMGYMVFQYQSELGYSARLQGESEHRRGNHAIAMAKISTLIKEAEFSQATQLFEEQVHLNTENLELFSKYFEFLLVTKNTQKLEAFLPKYFVMLKNQGRQDLVSRNYQRLVMRIQGFEINDPELKLLISEAGLANNDPKIAIKLLYGIHKKHPEFKDLIPALNLLAQSLDEYPKYTEHAKACRRLIDKLKTRTKNMTNQ
jgi:tetratricopeptide (TPR) repeat protein